MEIGTKRTHKKNNKETVEISLTYNEDKGLRECVWQNREGWLKTDLTKTYKG